MNTGDKCARTGGTGYGTLSTFEANFVSWYLAQQWSHCYLYLANLTKVWDALRRFSCTLLESHSTNTDVCKLAQTRRCICGVQGRVTRAELSCCGSETGAQGGDDVFVHRPSKIHAESTIGRTRLACTPGENQKEDVVQRRASFFRRFHPKPSSFTLIYFLSNDKLPFIETLVLRQSGHLLARFQGVGTFNFAHTIFIKTVVPV